MPEQDGYDLLRLVRADPQLNSIPVVAATGYVGSREQEQMAEAGFPPRSPSPSTSPSFSPLSNASAPPQ
jgi:CheY-like chemotaxis protein